MYRSLAASGALLGALLFMPLAHSPASAASPASGLKDLAGSAPGSHIDLVRQGGGGGGGGGGLSGGGGRGGGGGLAGGGGRGGGGAIGGGGRGGGGGLMAGGGRAGPSLGGGPRGGGRGLSAGPRGGRNFVARGGSEFRGGALRSDRRFAGRNFDRGDVRRFAHRGGNWKHRHRHRFHDRDFFIGGVGIYGAYAGGCHWLYQRAILTGSPYWWSRYHACVGYDVY
jgi:hypothetical protein